MLHLGRNGIRARCRRGRGVRIVLLPMTLSYHWRRWNSSHTAPQLRNTAIRSVLSLTKAYSHPKIPRNLQRQLSQSQKMHFISPAPAGRFHLRGIMTQREGCTLSPRQNVATSAVCAAACIYFTLRLFTHILLYRGFAIFGSSGRALTMASASTLVRAFLTLAEAPDMI